MLKLQSFDHLMWRTDSLEKTLRLEKIEGVRRRGWDGWMASLTQWTWVWANSKRQWRPGKPGVLQFMGWQRVGHDLATEQQWQQAFSWKTACLDIYYNMMHRVIFFLIINNAFHLLSIYHVLAPFPYCVCRGNAKIAIELNSLPFTSLNKLQNNPYFPYGLCPSEDCIAKETDC